ncbi:MAG TPA: hypothetical protein VKD72_23110 [Gemmataceae bacterium]|nr:hypothetical protein [Gemmataceae bacterium]
MNRLSKNIRGRLVAAALAVVLLGAGTVNAESPGGQKPGTKATPQFHVYSGWSPRTFMRHGSYNTIEEACNAAVRERAEGKARLGSTGFTMRVEIWQFDGSGDPRREQIVSYSVYTRSCKTWNLAGSSQCLQRALNFAEKTRRPGDELEVVYHFAATE